MNIQVMHSEIWSSLVCYSSLKHAVPSNIKTSACLATFKARQ